MKLSQDDSKPTRWGRGVRELSGHVTWGVWSSHDDTQLRRTQSPRDRPAGEGARPALFPGYLTLEDPSQLQLIT